jgi:hypothetical protein
MSNIGASHRSVCSEHNRHCSHSSFGIFTKHVHHLHRLCVNFAAFPLRSLITWGTLPNLGTLAIALSSLTRDNFLFLYKHTRVGPCASSLPSHICCREWEISLPIMDNTENPHIFFARLSSASLSISLATPLQVPAKSLFAAFLQPICGTRPGLLLLTFHDIRRHFHIHAFVRLLLEIDLG